MQFSWMKRVALVLGMLLPMAAPATTLAEMKPIAVVSLAGYDAIVSDLNYLGELSGAPQLAQSLEGIVALVTRAQGLVGLNKAKPIVAVFALSEEGRPQPLVFVPVTDSEKLLDALQGLVPTVEDLGDGISRLKPVNGPSVMMKEVGGWALLSDSEVNFDDAPADPAKFVGDLAKQYDLAVQLNIQNVPPHLIAMAVEQMKRGAAPGLKQRSDEDDDAYRVRKQMTEGYLNQVGDALKEIDQITLGFAIDSKAHSTYLDTTATVVKGGKLAKQLAAAIEKTAPSNLAGFADGASVANLHFNSTVVKDDQKVILDALKTARGQADQKIDEDDDIDGEDAKKAVKEMVADLFDVIEATIKAGHLNGGAMMTGDGPFEFVLGALAVDAKKLDGVVRRAVEIFGREADFPPVKLDAATHDGVTYHTLSVPAPDKDAEKILGEEVTVALGFGDDRVVIAFGEKPIDAAKSVLAKSKKANKNLPPAQLQLKLAPLVKLGAEADEKNREIAETMVELLEKSGKDHVNVTSDYIPNGSRMRIELEEGILEAFGKAAVQGMQRGR